MHFKSAIFSLLLFPATLLAEGALGDALVKADAQDAVHDTLGAIKSLEEANKAFPEQTEVLVRLSKQYSDLIQDLPSKPEKEKAARRALVCAKRAVELQPDHALAQLSLAICYGKLADFAGNKEKVECSKRIKEHVLESIKLNPADDFAWHVLGRWNFGIANLNGVLKALCEVVYGGLPVASNEDAAKYLKKASDIAPQRIMHRQYLARVFVAQGKIDKARTEWKAILELPSADKPDDLAKAEARESLKKYVSRR